MIIFQSKQNYVLFFLLVMLFQSCSTGTKENLCSDQEKEKLLTRVEQFNSAFRNGEAEKLKSMITKNYIHTNGKSKAIRKYDWVSYLQKRKEEISSGDLIVSNYLMDETEMEIYGDMAIVTAKISFSSVRAHEQKENEFRITNIWVQERGIWKRAGFHDTRIE